MTAPPSTLAERLAARDAQRFVGRRQELEFFDSLLVEDPPAQVVLVHGPGGIGKSTLLREVARRGAQRGYRSHMVEGRELAPVPGEIERALDGVDQDPQPLVLFDTYERMSAAGGWLRGRLLPSLPARSLVVLAGRTAPEPEWFQGGWEQLAVELKLEPLPRSDAEALVRAHGLADDQLARQLVAWADGSPLALALAADAVRDGGAWRPERIEEHPNLVRAIIRRVAETELDGGNLDVVAVAALARVCDAHLLRDVLPDVDPDEAQEWLRSRTFSERVGGGVALHDIVRQAIRADLRSGRAERERELRRRIADHFYARGTKLGVRTVVDLAELVENPAVRWGFGADGSTTYRPDLWRPEDAPVARRRFLTKPSGQAWWDRTMPILEQAPDRVVTVRNAMDQLCGLAIAVTPENAPEVCEQDVVLGPWLAYARREFPGTEVLLWRDSLDFVAHGDMSSPVLSILNTAAILRSGLNNPRWSFIPIDPNNEAAVAFARAVATRHVTELDVTFHGKVIECHVVDHTEQGLLGGVRAAVYGELGLAPPVDVPERPAAAPSDPATATITPDVVRDALRSLHQPLELAANPLARGTTPEARAASVRTEIEEAVAGAFGASADEQLLRRVIERGYLDPASSHELAAEELHVSRATYFRRLRTASQRVTDYLLAKHAR